MGTEKRERQKANRALKQQEVAKATSRRKWTRMALLIGGAVVLIFGLAFIASSVMDDDSAEAPVDTAATEPFGTVPADSVPADSAPLDSVPAATAPDGTAAAGTAECPPVDGAGEPVAQFDGPPPFCLDPDASYSAVVTTNHGEYTIELDQEAAPNTVNNFVFLARYGYFDDTPCHRIIPDFVVQCGDPTGTGTGGPGYEFADELPAAGDYQIGSVAMANSGPDTNGSQFFVVTGDSGVALPPSYSLFGQVTDGLDTTVAELAGLGSASGATTEDVTIESVRIVQS